MVSNTQLEKQLAGQPHKTQDEIIKINTQQGTSPFGWRF